jgi:AraC family transcriptional regulator of adaptative response / DNA-3-methyladenine glycosylase II
VAQTRRVLLAKQLIHETTLPMAEVALASGFNSVRRFNETFQHLFGRAPASLRRIRERGKERGKERDKREAGGLSIHLAYRPPYDWDAMLAFLAARAIPGVETVAEQVYRRSIAIGDASGVLSVAPAAKNRLHVTVRFPNMAALPVIIARVRRVFDLAADPETIGAHLAIDPVLAPLVAARPGLRVPGAWDGFELAVRAIFGQQITVPAATKLLGRLVELHGAALPEEMRGVDGLTHVFPSPARIARVDLGLGMPRARSMAVTSLAKALVADPAIFSPGASLEAAIAKLRALPGIGEWTAQYIAMRELREPDAFPAADIGLMRAMAASDGRRPTPSELLLLAERWRPWRAYAALHLWASGAAQPVSTAKVRHEREAA